MTIDESVSFTASSDLRNQGGFVFDEGIGMQSETSMGPPDPEPKLENGITVGLAGIY